MTWKGGLLLNVPALEKLLQNFYQISGMEVAVVNTQYRNVVSCRCPGNNFCASIHKSAKCVEVCMQSDLSKLRYVDETKKSLTYICPFGIFEAITPIMKNGFWITKRNLKSARKNTSSFSVAVSMNWKSVPKSRIPA